MGATVGQGRHYGWPGSLPRGRRAQARLPLIESPRTADRTPFEIVSRVRPVTRTTKSLLMPMSRHLEALAGTGPEPPVLLACFQDARFFTAASAERFARIASHSPLVAALGAGLTEEPAPGVRGAGLTLDDPLHGEWNVIVVGPHRAAALVARDVGENTKDGERQFDFALTHDRALVVEAARSLMRWLTAVPAPV
jgi:DICT domain-containing protein